jgi:2-polyprenyl-3-methyl-5-hydroxy-6-metoxy-1,4-benzoquinol methylase
LVAIASYGEKNIEFLKRVISVYRSMAMDVDIVVLSEATKNIDTSVKVIVGLPTKNPWSLPFAHKRIFVENVDRYDLFAYSEDDMLVTEANIHAFLRIAPALAQDEIAGFLRYEVDPSGTLFLPDVRGAYHWKPQTVSRRGNYSLAEFSNEHAAFYLLTQPQLKRAIASRGFIRDPYEGRYDMLCSAATDPYTCCGFNKLICISSIDDFLIHHMSNIYAGKVGLPLSAFKEQIQTLMDIQNGVHPAITLCEVEPKVLRRNWYKGYYEDPDDELLCMVPEDARNILSVGCGWGATEVELKQRGAKVTALPLDSVIGAVAAHSGIAMVYGTIEEGLSTLKGQKFDCVLITDLLYLLRDPWGVLMSCAQLIKHGGSLVLTGPNFEVLPHLINRILGVGDYRKLGEFSQSGLHTHSVKTIEKQIALTGLRVDSLRWINFPQPRRMLMLHRWPKRFVAKKWILKACQPWLR